LPEDRNIAMCKETVYGGRAIEVRVSSPYLPA
jgi:hypothetical protein